MEGSARVAGNGLHLQPGVQLIDFGSRSAAALELPNHYLQKHCSKQKPSSGRKRRRGHGCHTRTPAADSNASLGGSSTTTFAPEAITDLYQAGLTWTVCHKDEPQQNVHSRLRLLS